MSEHTEKPITPAAVKRHARPGSQWNSTQRKVQKAFDQPKGFARGCKVKPHPGK